MVISHVFSVDGRPVVVAGACEPGGLSSGDTVDVVRDGVVTATTRAFVEMHSPPGVVSLVLPDVVPCDVRPGFVIRRAPRCGPFDAQVTGDAVDRSRALPPAPGPGSADDTPSANVSPWSTRPD